MSTPFYPARQLPVLLAAFTLLATLALPPAPHPTAAASLLAVPATTGPVSAIAAGGAHTCALIDGGVLCWGWNSNGQLGDRTITSRTTPTPVSGLASGVTAIAAGGDHTCGLVNGSVLCWGNNFYGQLGDGTIAVNRRTPVAVSGLSSGVSAITAGASHTCAVVNGGVQCWGVNSDGQLGDGTTNDRRTPITVSGLSSGVTAVTAGQNHTCALVNGGIQCWGLNGGRLGDGTTTRRLTPVPVSGLTNGATAITAGSGHTCALVNGGVQCWGDNSNGQLGDGTFISQLTPALVSDLSSGVSAITAGGSHTCAVVNDGVQCWGYNFYGQLGDNTTTRHPTPVQVSGLSSGVSAITAGGVFVGGSHTCALVNGDVLCWGDNSNGQLGDGTTTRRLIPVPVTGFPLQAQRPELRTDQPLGAPGSDFLMETANLPPTTTLTIEINGTPLTSTVTTDATGVTSFTLDTRLDAQLGVYLVRVETPQGSQAETIYQLLIGQPVRTAPPDAPAPIPVPVEIRALDRLLYTAVVAR